MFVSVFCPTVKTVFQPTKVAQLQYITIGLKGLVKCEETFNLLATAVPIKPFDPNTVTTSPEKEERPPRPRFIEAVFRALPGLTCGARGVRHVCQALGPSSSEGQWCRTGSPTFRHRTFCR